MPSLTQSAIGTQPIPRLRLDFPTPSLPEQSADLFRPASVTSPLYPADQRHAEYDVDAEGCRFVAGWPSLRMYADSAPEDRRPSGPVPGRAFSAANPAGPAVRAAFARAYAQHAHDSQSIRQEVGRVILEDTRATALQRDAEVTTDTIRALQAYRMDVQSGTGHPYLHERDLRHAAALQPGQPIHTFLPGYATGDRYSLILAMLINPDLHVSIAYTAGNQAERRSAEEAAQVIQSALSATGQPGADTRVALFEYHGADLKKARESLDAADTRACFRQREGAPSPLAGRPADASTHVFHISATTELIARAFRDSSMPAAELHAAICAQLAALVPAATRSNIDTLVERVIAEQGIEPGAAALWIADREFANAREAEAISRPRMFEQIADGLKDAGIPIYCLADTYINRARDEQGMDRLTDRHPFRPELHPHVGRFWAAEVDGGHPLAARENQWYFMHRLLDRVGGPLIGIRSGALEPFALMGHQVIYLEHKDMFTPERHACWQGIIPYHRMITSGTTGYLEKHTETFRANETRTLISDNVLMKQAMGNNASQQELIQMSRQGTSPLRQQVIAGVDDDLQKGVLSGNELQLLLEMARSGTTALATATALWPPTNP